MKCDAEGERSQQHEDEQQHNKGGIVSCPLIFDAFSVSRTSVHLDRTVKKLDHLVHGKLKVHLRKVDNTPQIGPQIGAKLMIMTCKKPGLCSSSTASNATIDVDVGAADTGYTVTSESAQ